MSLISVVWGTTPKKKNLHDAGLYPHLNTQEHFTADFWLTAEQQRRLNWLLNHWNGRDDIPSAITGFQVIRGAFHGHYTRIRPIMENWGAEYATKYHLLLDRIAEAIGWYHVRIDGANAVIKQNPVNKNTGVRKTTWERWKTQNPSSHLRESSRKNWEVYHDYIGDSEEVGEWDEELYVPEAWQKTNN